MHSYCWLQQSEVCVCGMLWPQPDYLDPKGSENARAAVYSAGCKEAYSGTCMPDGLYGGGWACFADRHPPCASDPATPDTNAKQAGAVAFVKTECAGKTSCTISGMKGACSRMHMLRLGWRHLLSWIFVPPCAASNDNFGDPGQVRPPQRCQSFGGITACAALQMLAIGVRSGACQASACLQYCAKVLEIGWTCA